MEIRDIRYFKVVGEHKNIGRAAEALGLSSTALSKSLRRLEKTVGARLVTRTSRGVALTAVGNALITRAGTLQLALDDIRREAADLGDGRAGHVNVGANPGICEYVVADAYSALLKEAPHVSLRSVVLYGGQFRPALRAGQLDFSVNTVWPALPPDIACVELIRDRWVVYAAESHPLANRKRVTFADLAKERWASDINAASWNVLRQMFEARGLQPPTLLLETNSIEMRLPVIAASNLLMMSTQTTLSKAMQRFRLVGLSVEGLNLRRAVAVYYRKDGYLPPAAKRMIEILKEQGRAITTSTRDSK